MSPANREFELKLSLTGDELDRLAEKPEFGGEAGERSRKELKSIYFDTPDNRLRDKGIALRVRDEGKGFVQTVKMETRLQDGLSNPIEIEDRVESLEPDTGRIGDRHVRELVLDAVEGSTLAKVFETVVTRTTHRLQRGHTTVELALDKGEARAKGRRSEICEAELELIEGDADDLLDIAQSLFSKCPFQLSSESKAERGYRLLLDVPESKRVAPAHAEKPKVDRGQTSGQAFAEIFRSARDQIVKNRSVVLQTDEPEGAHQLRVGLTRLRSAHRALKSFMDNRVLREMEDDARALSHAAGQLRDADVMIADIYAPVAGAPPGKPGFDELHEALQAHRAAAQSDARAALQGEHWSRLLLSLTLWPHMLERDPALEQPIEDYASKALQKRWKKVAESGRRLEALDDAGQHKMRRSLKKLRYMLEFFEPVFDADAACAFVKRLKKLQDVFGYVNDVRMAAQLRSICAERCRGGPDPSFAAGYVCGRHDGAASEVWKKAPKEWRRLKSLTRFWQ
jgi:inorganic triphosphatase YgiF